MKVSVVVAIAVLCLFVGFFVGNKAAQGSAQQQMQADMNEVRFARTVNALSTTIMTLGLIEQRRGDAIVQLQEKTLTQYARDAKDTVGFARHIGDRAAGIDQSLAAGMDYAQRHGMKEAFNDLGATRQALKTMSGK